MKFIAPFSLSLLIGTALITQAGVDVSILPPPASKKDVTFAKDIKTLFDASCSRCHGAERPKAGLRLDTLENVLKGSKEGPVLVKGDSTKSFIVEAVSQLDPETAMPPKRGPGGPGGGKKGGQGPAGGFARERGTNAPAGGPGQRPGGPRGNFPPPKPLTAEQVGLVRAWIDQGAK